ncbi:MAG: toxic anion resistance protein [Clostridia bacterium]|nr:toxic anion resistance protein [Clostridia bacterium]
MSNSDHQLVSRAEIELLISEMSISPLSDKEYSRLISFVNQIIITDSTLVNEYGSLYQRRFAALSSKGTDVINDNKDITDTQELIDMILSAISDFHDYQIKTSNLDLVQIRFIQTMNTIRGCRSKLRNNKLLLETNLEAFNSLIVSVRKCEYWITMYLLAGRIKLKQVDALLALYRNGDRSRIKNAEIEAFVIRCMKVFEEKLTSLEYTRTICMQLLASLQIQIQNNQLTIETISSVIGATIPAFENENALSY